MTTLKELRKIQKDLGIKEFQVENEILTFLNYTQNCMAFKIETGGYYDPTKRIFRRRKSKFHVKGLPDILGFYKGVFFALEVKRAAGVVSPEQRAVIERINRRGGLAQVVYCIDDAKKLLEKIDAESHSEASTCDDGI